MKHIKAPEGAIDNCGTGGDKSNTFNISTAAAILIAAGGVCVAKHGNRAATSICGSADVLDALHIPIDLSVELAERSLEEDNFVFLFAPLYHPALKRLSGIRKSLGHPTIFNILGPLLNPAKVDRQIIGTFNSKNCQMIAEVVCLMNTAHSIVLTSENGLDEASLNGVTHIYEVHDQIIETYNINAADFGMQEASNEELIGGDASTNARIILEAFSPPTSELSAHQRAIVYNAGLGFYISDKFDSLKSAIIHADQTLRSGAAMELLMKLSQ
jgi:anthranilate phosphoribosyltransferase